MQPTDHQIVRHDGRVVAWTECGSGDHTLLRLPGTPGSRWSVPDDARHWQERELRVLTTERPGFGASTPLPGRGFTEHADDLAAVLDHAGIGRVFVIGPSGAAPYILSLCERHAERVVAAAIVAGSAPITPDEAAGMIATNRVGHDLVRAGDRSALQTYLADIRAAFISEPTSIDQLRADDSSADHDALAGDGAQHFLDAMRRALVHGVEGWVDETFALLGDWDDVHPEGIRTPISWYHASNDRNCPYRAAERLVGRIPTARLVTLPHDVAHLIDERHEIVILDELLEH